MTAELELIDEDSATAETVTVLPELVRRLEQKPATCDALWLPACAMCSWIMLSRRPSLDRMETPGFYIARHTTEKYGSNYYMLRGCPHAVEIGCKIGPIPAAGRLKVAAVWRQRAGQICRGMYSGRWTAEQRAQYGRRFWHPTLLTPII